jgi:hypothetical protein
MLGNKGQGAESQQFATLFYANRSSDAAPYD